MVSRKNRRIRGGRHYNDHLAAVAGQRWSEPYFPPGFVRAMEDLPPQTPEDIWWRIEMNMALVPDGAPRAIPKPLGEQENIQGQPFLHQAYVDSHPELPFTKYMWFNIEINDHLFSLICPSDLNGVPCEHDELSLGGCHMLRLCAVSILLRS